MVAYNRRNFRAKATAFKKRVNSNLPVKRAITKYKRLDGKKPLAQKTTNNRNAIMTLAKQVRNLQVSN